MKQTYGVEVDRNLVMFADELLEAIFREFQTLDAVGDQKNLAERLTALNRIIEPFGYVVIKKPPSQG